MKKLKKRENNPTDLMLKRIFKENKKERNSQMVLKTIFKVSLFILAAIVCALLLTSYILIERNADNTPKFTSLSEALTESKTAQTTEPIPLSKIAEKESVSDTTDNMNTINLGVPNIDSSFKTWMDYRKITNTSSNQYKYIRDNAQVDEEGFMRTYAELNNGNIRKYYLIALGSYYGTEIGTKYRITTDTGNVFYGVLADCKADIHTDEKHQYGVNNNDVVEFLVDADVLNKKVKRLGSAGAYEPLSGKIVKIEIIDQEV